MPGVPTKTRHKSSINKYFRKHKPPFGSCLIVFRPRWKASTSALDMHRGIDFFGEVGDPIYAMADGVVFKKGWQSSSAGYGIVIEHPIDPGVEFHPEVWGTQANKWFSYSLHLDMIEAGIEVGVAVTAGQRIGSMGQSGSTTFTHLHLETRLGGYCSLQWALASGKDPAPTDKCRQGFDPHVHPFLFMNGKALSGTHAHDNASVHEPCNGGDRKGAAARPAVEETAPLNSSYVFALRATFPRNNLAFERVLTDFGDLSFSTRRSMNATTMSTLDDLYV